MKKWNIGWGTVANCNMQCQFCYSKERRKTEESLRLSDWIKFVDENNQRINTINYGTGENSLSDKWFELINYVRVNYPMIRQALTTNGYLSERIKNKELYRIVTNSIDEVDVSLDFSTPEEHNTFRGTNGAFEWAINTLSYCKKENKDATIVFLGSEVNLIKENIKGLFEIAERYNAKLRMNLYRPTEGINTLSKRFIPSYERILDILQYISKNYEILSLNDSLFSAILTTQSFFDPSGIDSLRILANGDITPSTYLIQDEYVIGNIREDPSLKNIENNIKNIICNILPDECGNCILKDRCKGGVIDRRYLWYNNLERKDPYCQGPYYDRSLLPQQLVLSHKKFRSVHDGYLPTMFFINKN